eukprot:7388202-Prymnesium_polylepis.2
MRQRAARGLDRDLAAARGYAADTQTVTVGFTPVESKTVVRIPVRQTRARSSGCPSRLSCPSCCAPPWSRA